MGQYLYCVIKAREELPRVLTSVNGQEAGFVSYRDIAAVVSSTSITSFDRLDKEKLTSYVTIHQKINEEVMKNYNVVPIAFGIIAPSVGEVQRILERAYLQLKTALKKVEGKVEFAVQVRWEQKKLLEELANANPEIQRLKQKPKKSIFGLAAKLKLGRLIQEKVEAQRQSYIKDIQTSLKKTSRGFTSNKLIKTNGSIDEEMIANLSFLIERVEESELDKKMNKLGKKYEGRLKFKYIGPMPPYSFTNINLSLGNFELVNEARLALGLDEEATLDEIKRAYYKLAHQYHPDKHGANREEFQEPGFDELTTRMKKIAQAYSVLGNYCQSCGQKQKYSFREEDVRDAVMVH